MKNVSVMAGGICVLLMSFTTVSPERRASVAASEETALNLVEALKESSTRDFIGLLPTLEEFQAIMKENGSFYGDNLGEAQAEFAHYYTQVMLPLAEKSFDALLMKSKKVGLNWHEAKVEAIYTDDDNSLITPFTVLVYSGGKHYRLQVDRAFQINGKWKLSHYISLN